MMLQTPEAAGPPVRHGLLREEHGSRVKTRRAYLYLASSLTQAGSSRSTDQCERKINVCCCKPLRFCSCSLLS